jgi:ribosomal protein S18 acetylase RimI-like enzyme
MWRSILNRDAKWGADVFVAERDGEMVGFGACGAQRDDALRQQGFDGEIGAIYVLRARQRIGVGRALMAMLARRLREQGRRAANLWVLRENAPARAFYERLGGTLGGERTDEVHGATVIEVAYTWNDLAALERSCC